MKSNESQSYDELNRELEQAKALVNKWKRLSRLHEDRNRANYRRLKKLEARLVELGEDVE